MKNGTIFNIQYFSIHDGPGIRTLVFLKGCPLSCKWCANPESQAYKPEVMVLSNRCIGCGNCIDKCPEKAIIRADATNKIIIDRNKCTTCGVCVRLCNAESLQIKGQIQTVDEVLEKIEKDTIFYDHSGGGVTISGGEPFYQADFTYSLLKACKERAINTAIETSGYTSYENIERCLPYLDTIFYDIKHLDSNKHKKFTGLDNTIILNNIRELAKVKADIIVRVPIIPGFNDDKTHLLGVAEFVKKLNIKELNILPYHGFGIQKYRQIGRQYELEISSPSSERMNDIYEILSSNNINVQIS